MCGRWDVSVEHHPVMASGAAIQVNSTASAPVRQEAQPVDSGLVGLQERHRKHPRDDVQVGLPKGWPARLDSLSGKHIAPVHRRVIR